MIAKVLRVLTVAVLFSSVMAVKFVSVARAQNEESEEARQTAEKAKRRHYPSGRDEQELTVQASIPMTSRYPVDPKAVTGKEKVQPADEGHD